MENKNEQLAKLQAIASDVDRNKLYRRVASDALDSGDIDEAISHLESAANNITGGVSGLIYYKDTHAFFDEYYDEIQSAVYECQQDTGEDVTPIGDIKNWYTWFAYEYVARLILDELETE